MANFPGPYEVRYRYTPPVSGQQTLEHVQKLNCQLDSSPLPGSSLVGVNVITRSTLTTDLTAAVQGWLNLIRGLYATTTDFFACELWKYTAGTFDATFIAPIAASTQGTSGFANQANQQSIYTFRTQEGGLLRLTFMETFLLPGLRESPPYVNAISNDIANFVNSPLCWLLARDTSYPIATLHHLPGQNEALFKRRFRP